MMAMAVSGFVVDYSLARPGAAVLKAAGASGVMRYIAPGRSDGAQITAPEIEAFTQAGLPYGLVMEYGAQWLLDGYSQGVQYAQQAIAEEASLGISRGVTYMAADFGIQPSQYGQALDTLHGLSDGYGGWQYVGVYGRKAFCEWVGANTPIVCFWSTDAWSAGIPAANACLHQKAVWPAGVPIIDGCDYNLVLGNWAPRNGADLTPEEHNILITTAKAVVQLAGAVTALQNSQNALSQNIIHGDATHYSFDLLHADINQIKAALAAGSGGTVDPAPIADAVASKVSALTWKAS